MYLCGCALYEGAPAECHSAGATAATSVENAMRTFKVGRSAVTGRFTTVRKARRCKRTHVVQTIKVPARGRRRL